MNRTELGRTVKCQTRTGFLVADGNFPFATYSQIGLGTIPSLVKGGNRKINIRKETAET